jgi:tetratricopeptide (TPR) repeat protein
MDQLWKTACVRSNHCYEQAYAGAVKIESVQDQAQILSALGDLLGDQGDNERAIGYYRQALRISR